MRRGPGALLLATVAHAALLVLIGAATEKRRGASRDRETKDVDLELDLRVLLEGAPAVPRQVDPAAPGRSEGPLRHLAGTSARRAPQGGGSPMASREPTVRSEDSQVTPSMSPVDELPPGFQVPPTGLAPRPSNPILGALTAEGPAEDNGAERAIRSSIYERDLKLGLGASGPVVAAVEGVARTSRAAVESHAVLDVVADADGQIVSVTVSDASEDWAGWDAVARSLLAAMGRTRVHVPHGSRGVLMTIAIDSREALPSGAAPGVNVSLFDQKVHSGKNERSASVAILPLARLPITVPVPGRPGVTQTKSIVLPIPTNLVSGTFDETDFGANAARVVHAHVTSEREL
jgi:hypothetical protein